jgi:hypothetical protein
MSKEKKLHLSILIIIGGILLYCWSIILFTEIEATWRHYLAIILFIPLLILFKRDFKKDVLFTGVYLILGTCNLLTLTPSVTSNSYGVRIGSVEVWTPTFQLYSFLILILFFMINFNTLVNYYLDYQDSKKVKQNINRNMKT